MNASPDSNRLSGDSNGGTLKAAGTNVHNEIYSSIAPPSLRREVLRTLGTLVP